MQVIEAIGWLGGLCYSISCISLVIKVFKTKSTEDLTWGFLALWFFGVTCMTTYVTCNGTRPQIPLIVDNLLGWCIVVYIMGVKIKYNNER